MINQARTMSSTKCAKYNLMIRLAHAKGYCLACGEQVSLCGIPFSGEIACNKCRAINVFRESQQPTEVRTIALSDHGESMEAGGA
jgi:hypothetical protein